MPIITNNRLPHTLLFCGPRQESLAIELTIQLMGEFHAPRLKKKEHPDLHIYIPEGKTQTHPVESIRQLIDEVALAPFEAPAKMFFIYEAERMQPVSSNALLKTLEEPPPNTYFALFSEHPEALLPTIVSRCYKILPSATPNQSPPITPLLLNILTATDPISRSKAIIELDEQVEAEENPAIKAQTLHTLFEHILHWYRDLHLLSLNLPQYLIHERPSGHPIPLEKILPLVEECRFAAQQHIKLRTILEHFFLRACR